MVSSLGSTSLPPSYAEPSALPALPRALFRTSAASLQPESLPLLRLPLLRFADARFPGNLPVGVRIPALKIKIPLESKPLKSRMIVHYGDWL